MTPSYSLEQRALLAGLKNLTQYAQQMDDVDRYPSERERALKATVLGMILGVGLAMLARRPRLA